jgi:starch synthase
LHNTRSLLTVHNGVFQGQTEAKWLNGLGIIVEQFYNGYVEHRGLINILKCGILSADKVNAVSHGYYQELLDDYTSHELGYCYRNKADGFTGILNGCDYDQWNPDNDPYLIKGFSKKNLSGKKLCKAHLQEQMRLPVKPDIPVLGMVSRLTDQKGFDYLIPAMEMVLNQGFLGQFALLGSGNPEYGSRLHHLQNRFPEHLSFVNGYDVGLSHRIEAGADFFVMPSLFEPCGLNQLYSLAYGALPIVRRTGGLKDTIVGLEEDLTNVADATGIDFEIPSNDSMAYTLNRAEALYIYNKDVYDRLQYTAMGQLFTWQKSAAEYENLYNS